MNTKLQDIRAQFPVCKDVAYFNTGTCGPMPQVCAEAMNNETYAHLTQGRASIPDYKAYLEGLDTIRQRLATLIHADSLDEILITHHTTEGLNVILWGINWQPGDVIVTSTHEHGGLLAPLAMLFRKFGVDILYLPFTGEPEQDQELLRSACRSARVKMLAMSHVSYIDGRVFPIQQLTDLAHQEGASVLIDGAQSVGALPVDVQELGVDFYAAPGQKWLCAPEGTGMLYIRSSWISRIHPVFTGFFGLNQLSWNGQRTPYIVPAEGAQRFRTGGFCRQAIYGLEASLTWLQDEIGMDWIFQHSRKCMAYLRAQLAELEGIEIVTPEGHASPLLSFYVHVGSPIELRDALAEQHILIRDIAVGEPTARISVSFFHTPEELDRLVLAISSWVKEQSA